MRMNASFKDILKEKMSEQASASSQHEVDFTPYLGQLLVQISRREFQRKPNAKFAYKGPATSQPQDIKAKKPVRPNWTLSESQTKALMQFELWGHKLEANFEVSALKQAFRKLALKLHPDQSKGDAGQFLKLKQYYADLLQATQASA